MLHFKKHLIEIAVLISELRGMAPYKHTNRHTKASNFYSQELREKAARRVHQWAQVQATTNQTSNIQQLIFCEH